MESASASIALFWMSSTAWRSAKRSTARSTSCRPTLMRGSPDTTSNGPIRAAGASAKVESRCGAVAVGRTYLLPPLSFSGASLARPWLCFHIPLIEPDVQISRIRLSDKTSRLRPRLAAPTRGQAYETVMPVEVREWIRPAPASPDLVLETQPPAQPHRGVVVERPIRFRD